MRLTGGLVFDPARGFVERDVCIQGGKIAACAQDPVDVGGCWVIPGLTDLHFHGCRGADFSDGEAEGLREMAAYELSRGVTQICPAGMTLAEEQLVKICQVAAAHRASGAPGAELVGINLGRALPFQGKKRRPERRMAASPQSSAAGKADGGFSGPGGAGLRSAGAGRGAGIHPGGQQNGRGEPGPYRCGL